MPCRAQAIAIGQALVDGRWLDCVTHHDQLFRDEYALYRPLQVSPHCWDVFSMVHPGLLTAHSSDRDVSVSNAQSTEFSETPSPDSDSVNSLEGHSEPSWFKDIKFDDSDTEQLAEENEYTVPSMSNLWMSSHLKPWSFCDAKCFGFQTLPAPAKELQSAASTRRWTATQRPLST